MTSRSNTIDRIIYLRSNKIRRIQIGQNAYIIRLVI